MITHKNKTHDWKNTYLHSHFTKNLGKYIISIMYNYIFFIINIALFISN